MFFGLHRKPVKSLTRDLLCLRRPQAPSGWGEDAKRLLDWVLEAQAKKWTQRASVLQGVSLKKKRERERETERERDRQRPELRWSGIRSFIFKRGFYTLSYTFLEMKDIEVCRVSSTIHLFNPYRNQDVLCIPFHLQGSCIMYIIFWPEGLLTFYDLFLIKVGQPENLFFL